MKLIKQSFLTLLLMSGLLGGVYPGLIWIVAQTAFHAQANGSLIRQNGHIQGSALIGQSFTSPQYFWGRLSATSPMSYNPQASTASNLGPSNPALVDQATSAIQQYRRDPYTSGPIPVDLVTASGSGLDPGISVAGARYQVARVAHARHMDEQALLKIVDKHTQAAPLGIIGEPTVNVLTLNIELDKTNPVR